MTKMSCVGAALAIVTLWTASAFAQYAPQQQRSISIPEECAAPEILQDVGDLNAWAQNLDMTRRMTGATMEEIRQLCVVIAARIRSGIPFSRQGMPQQFGTPQVPPPQFNVPQGGQQLVPTAGSYQGQFPECYTADNVRNHGSIRAIDQVIFEMVEWMKSTFGPDDVKLGVVSPQELRQDVVEACQLGPETSPSSSRVPRGAYDSESRGSREFRDLEARHSCEVGCNPYTDDWSSYEACRAGCR